MQYQIIPQTIPFDRRAEINEKILHTIDIDSGQLPKEVIYNCYTGKGGLHNLKQSDFSNYHEYSQAKKEIEMGQFFTPHELCRTMVDVVAPEPTEMILDMCCGMGNFFNYLPNLFNAFGFDIDPYALKVARHLYPDATVEKCDIRNYKPQQRFDIVIGNPPFNLDFDGTKSQFYYCNKAYWVLNPGGLLIMVVPATFMKDEFWDKSTINAINRDFSFIGQTRLHPNTFASIGVHNFDTKVMAFRRFSENIENKPYNAEEFILMDILKERIVAERKAKEAVRLQLMQETNELLRAEEEAFEYRLKKYLYEIKTHPHLKEKHPKAIALLTKFRNQHCPVDATEEERERFEKTKLTYGRVLSVLRKYIKNQCVIPQKKVALVRTTHGFMLKGYAPRMLDGVTNKYVSMYNLVLEKGGLPEYPKMTPELRAQYAVAIKTVERKRREYLHQSKELVTMDRDPELDKYIDSLTFYNPRMEVCRFTDLQKHDMGLVYQKRYSLLNWQQGSGKTGVAYHFGKMLLERKAVKNIVIAGPAIATDMTWEAFLKRHGDKYVVLRKPRDFDNIPEGVFVIISLSMQGKLKRPLRRFMKERCRKVCLIFDESDEITNPTSQRTKLSLAVFRRTKYKMLTTGTTTRNNITELYSQFELLYNNSVNMMCWCPDEYYEDKEGRICQLRNSYYGEPFPPRGANHFKASFCPGKTSVFGIEKLNQDIYNQEQLAGLIAKTIITRKFREFAGDKYEVFTHYVKPSEGEYSVYKSVLEEFHKLCHLFFNPIKDSRKESQLRLIRQIQLLVKSCSVPQLFPEYFGDRLPSKARFIANMIKEHMPGKVAIGCTTIDALNMYSNLIEDEFPERKLFEIKGDVSFKRRQKIIDEFEATSNGILISTQQSLKSSVNIPHCEDIILESMQWNIPKMEQYYFRFIRLDSPGTKNVHFVNYEDSIEQNLMALVLAKEQLNDFIKTGQVRDRDDIYSEYDISSDMIESLLQRKQDSEGNFYISWGEQKIC